jgi:protein ImuB
MSVPRCCTVWCPDWPVVAAGVTTDRPVAVVHANRVVAASRAARADGVRTGQRRREAQRACPGLEVVEHDPERDTRAFEPVLRAVESLTPLVEVTTAGTCTFGVRGPSRYHGGDDRLAALVTERVAVALGPASVATGPAGAGVADGRFAAAIAARRAAARAAEGSGVSFALVVPAGESAAFLAPLPVAVLTADAAELAELLPRLGIHTLGGFAALPRAEVAARFGHVGSLAHRLASGLDERPPDARRPPPELTVETVFEPAVAESGPAVFASKALAEQLHLRLQTGGLACPCLVVTAETEHGERLERSWRHELAFTPAAMVERVRWQLEGWAQRPDGPTGGLTLVRIAPAEVVADTGRQLGFWGGQTRADERALRAVARLEGLLGPEQVTVPEWRGGRGPGEAVITVPAASTDLVGRTVAPPPRHGPWPGRLPTPSPSTVLAEPRAVRVLDADGEVVTVSGRGWVSAEPVRLGIGATERAVAAWAGPWLLDERWWDPVRHRRRARFQVLTDDGRAHLLAREGGEWWLEATYD